MQTSSHTTVGYNYAAIGAPIKVSFAPLWDIHRVPFDDYHGDDYHVKSQDATKHKKIGVIFIHMALK